jgi:hypothetical protein
MPMVGHLSHSNLVRNCLKETWVVTGDAAIHDDATSISGYAVVEVEPLMRAGDPLLAERIGS